MKVLYILEYLSRLPVIRRWPAIQWALCRAILRVASIPLQVSEKRLSF
ncbi:MAG: hypothetical protein V1736_07075 [Pseudomonadota bacterium]